MAEPYIGEIRMFAGNFAPAQWALCDGSTLSIADNQALFTLIGTTYGGDGQTTFVLPDLRGRAPLHHGASYPLGDRHGSETVTLAGAQLPVHTHGATASSAAGTSNSPADAVWATSSYTEYAAAQSATVAMAAQAISAVGGNQPHENMMPFGVVNYIISLAGYYPSPS